MRAHRARLCSVQQVVADKDDTIRQLQRQVNDLQASMHKHDALLKDRDVQIAFMLHRSAPWRIHVSIHVCRCSYLDEAASYAPLLDQLSNTLKHAFASTPPKLAAGAAKQSSNQLLTNGNSVAQSSMLK
jgi:hypothetical protein